MAKITKEIMEKLSYYEYNINGRTFKENYVKAGGSERLAEHLWSKFNGYDHSILKLWGNLDKENKKLVAEVINKGYK